MAILDSKTLAAASQLCERAGTVDYRKQQLYAALQAVEDALTSVTVKTALSNAINTATAPKVLTAAQKREIVKSVIVTLAARWA